MALYVVYFDQLLGAARTQKLVKAYKNIKIYSIFLEFKWGYNEFASTHSQKCY